MKSGQTEVEVEAQGHRKPYPGAPISIPPSSGVNVAANVTESQPRQIVPTLVSVPISPIMTPSEINKLFRERDAQQEKQILERAAKLKEERKMGIE